MSFVLGSLSATRNSLTLISRYYYQVISYISFPFLYSGPPRHQRAASIVKMSRFYFKMRGRSPYLKKSTSTIIFDAASLPEKDS